MLIQYKMMRVSGEEVKIADEVSDHCGSGCYGSGWRCFHGRKYYNEVIGKLGIKNLSKGVKVDVLEGVVTVSLALNLKYDYSIMEVTKKFRKR